MKLSICITSCNRLKYTKALIESLSDFYDDPSVEILVVDMWSSEPGLRDYLKSLEESKIISFIGMEDGMERNWTNDEYIGRNKLIDKASGEYLMFLQDDGQFIGTSDVVWELIKDFSEMENVYCLDIYGVRKQSMRDSVERNPILCKKRKYWKRKDRHLLTTGIYKKKIYEKIGKYPTEWPQEKKYWGMSESWYAKAFRNAYPEGQVYRIHVPIMISIWNDPRGGYAFVRENKRFGHYLDPIDGTLYYEKNVTIEKLKELNEKSIGPVSFMEIANPIGWKIATTEDGEQIKYGQWIVVEEGPEEII